MVTNIPEEILYMISKESHMELTPEEESQLHRWLAANQENENEIREMRRFLIECECANLHHSLDLNESWRKIDRNTPKVPGWKRKMVLRRWVAVAAVVVPFLFACTVLLYLNEDRQQSESMMGETTIKPGTAKAELILANGETIILNEGCQEIIDDKGQLIGVDSSNTLIYKAAKQPIEEWNTLHIPVGGEYQLVLSDGTKVWMNAGTELKYPVQFQGKERKVELKGEAYFEVAKNKAHPFIVKTVHAGIRVLGTSFNVSCYEEDDVEQTTLIQGSVEVILQGKVCALQPGKQLQLNVKEQTVIIEDVDTQLYSSWKDGVFRFCNMPLEELAIKLQRWYNVHFFFVEDECRDVRFTGAIRKYADFQEFIKLIETTTQVKFLITGEMVTIQKK